MLVDESIFGILEKVSNITMTDYEIRWFNSENIEGHIEAECMLSMIEDLLCEIEHLEEKIEDIIQDRNDNYKPIPYAEQVGISDRDFI